MIPIDAVLSWLLTYAIHSTMLLVAAAVAAWKLADHHAWLDAIWKTALIAPLVTASLNVAPVARPLGGRWEMPAATTASGAKVIEPAAVLSEPPAAAEPVGALAVVDRPAESSKKTSAVETGSARASMASNWPSIAIASWLIVALTAVARYGARLRRVYRALGSGSPVTTPDLLDTSIRLTTSPVCPVPLALAGRRIVVPERFLHELDPEQQRAALAHETAHVVRRDPEWRIAVEILERLLFFQPLNRLARARLSDSAEFLCDQWAVQQTESPLALARCLSVIASWWSPADELPAGVSAMARSDSAMVRRVTRILDEHARKGARPRLLWLAIPVALVAVAAPRVTAAQLPAPGAGNLLTLPKKLVALTAVATMAPVEGVMEQRTPQRDWTTADIAAARAQLRVQQPAVPAGSLEERWRQAMADASRKGVGDFWMGYMFNTPTHAGDVMISDTRDGSTIVADGYIRSQGPPLNVLFNQSAAVPLEGGNVAVLLHYRGARADALDRATYRSAQVGFDFDRTTGTMFWLGDAAEAQSFELVKTLFGQARGEKLQVFFIELASLHSNSDAVIPFLTSLVDPKWPAAIRQEAAEGFDHHHDPRSVEVLMRVAKNDGVSEVRAEAAETIGEVQVAQSIPALIELVDQSPDPAVRQEAAEAFGTQPPERALPAIEHVLANSTDEAVLEEAIEAIGELQAAGALGLLVKIVNTHANHQARLEAVETIGELDEPGAVDALAGIVREHADVEIQREAVETIGDRHDDDSVVSVLEQILHDAEREEVVIEAIETMTDLPETSIHPKILDLAITGASPRVRREAIDAIADTIEKINDARTLDDAQRTFERVIFDDPDSGVRNEALDALEHLPRERATRVLRDVIDRHPDARMRREAAEQLRERQQ
jgi:HEAT repeat protein/beta-lactamase regulating signal transducer with metallopeptidase domain